MGTIRVVARIKARSDKVQEVKRLLSSLVAPTRREEGCIAYELLQNSEDPTDFTFVEEWTGPEALGRHFESAHILGVLPQLPELSSEKPDIRTYSLVD